MEQGSKAWLEWRSKGVGASDAPTVMGENPYKTQYELWEEKVGVKEAFKGNARTERGHALEPAARAEFEKITGYTVVPQLATHPVHKWMLASLDGLSFDGKHMVEIKCPGPETHKIALDGEVPPWYKAQLQHQMAVVGLDKMFYLSFDGVKAVVIEVYRNEFYIDSMIPIEEEFWKRVQTFNPPDNKFTKRNDEAWNKAAEKWMQAHKQLKDAEALEALTRQSLIDLSNSSCTAGAGVKLSKIVKKGSVNYNAIPELQGVDLDAYRKKPIESWRLACG